MKCMLSSINWKADGESQIVSGGQIKTKAERHAREISLRYKALRKVYSASLYHGLCKIGEE